MILYIQQDIKLVRLNKQKWHTGFEAEVLADLFMVTGVSEIKDAVSC